MDGRTGNGWNYICSAQRITLVSVLRLFDSLDVAETRVLPSAGFESSLSVSGFEFSYSVVIQCSKFHQYHKSNNRSKH